MSENISIFLKSFGKRTFTVVLIHGRFDTNRSRFDTHVKSFRYTTKVDSIQDETDSTQTEVNSLHLHLLNYSFDSLKKLCCCFWQALGNY